MRPDTLAIMGSAGFFAKVGWLAGGSLAYGLVVLAGGGKWALLWGIVGLNTVGLLVLLLTAFPRFLYRFVYSTFFVLFHDGGAICCHWCVCGLDIWRKGKSAKTAAICHPPAA
ncbi:MAG: hypothetical protein HC913_14135 [Microscillaceae bacterium]|nr:hypothetical protein [Microscillaceae bacterium]